MATIILAEDEEIIRTLVRKLLSRAGHTVHEASNGHEALELNALHSPDLVITDMLMPMAGGDVAIRALRESHPDVRIIAMSGGGRGGSAFSTLTRAKELGAHQVLAKPFTLAEFMTVVNETLRHPGSRSPFACSSGQPCGA